MFHQIILYLFNCQLYTILCGHKYGGRIDHTVIHALNGITILCIEEGDLLNFITIKHNSYRIIGIGRKYIDCITFNPEISTLKQDLAT